VEATLSAARDREDVSMCHGVWSPVPATPAGLVRQVKQFGPLASPVPSVQGTDAVGQFLFRGRHFGRQRVRHDDRREFVFRRTAPAALCGSPRRCVRLSCRQHLTVVDGCDLAAVLSPHLRVRGAPRVIGVDTLLALVEVWR
jgi:hypothetical protein